MSLELIYEFLCPSTITQTLTFWYSVTREGNIHRGLTDSTQGVPFGSQNFANKGVQALSIAK